MAIRTTAVGSWWPLEAYAADLVRCHDGQIVGDDAEKIFVAAAAAAVKEQIELGLDEWTGGEYGSDFFVNSMNKVLTGIEIVDPGLPSRDDWFDYDDLPQFAVVGEVGAPNGLGFAEIYRRERNVPGDVMKATCLGPLTMLVEAVIAMTSNVDAIKSQMGNLIGIVNRELRDLAAAGCPHIVLDEPVIGIMVNTGQMTPEDAAQLIVGCFDGVSSTSASPSDRAPLRGIHICNGNMRGRPASPVLRNAPWVEILEHLDGVIDIACLECSYFSEYVERDAFAKLPQSIQLAAGIVDEANYHVEPVKKIRDRAADWARVVGEERLWITTSCGFGRHVTSDVPRLRAKVENMVEAARSL